MLKTVDEPKANAANNAKSAPLCCHEIVPILIFPDQNARRYAAHIAKTARP